MNHESVDMTAEMADATFPLLYVLQNDQKINCMHATVAETNTAFVCDGITPVDAGNRTISFQMDLFENHVNEITYEVRNTSGDRLIENGKIENLQTAEESGNDNKLNFSVTLKDLLQSGQEYVVRLQVKSAGRNTIYFDTRICLVDDIQKADQVIAFALDFSSRTFDREAAKEITKYLESNEEGDNTTFAKVNIHSSFSQITWGSLNVKKADETGIRLQWINPYVAAVKLSYPVILDSGIAKERYNVREYYQVRFGSERMYLLDYQRTMDSVFEPVGPSFSNNKILLNITDPDAIDLVESEDGNVFAFVKEGSLYSFNTGDNKTSRIFSFYDEDHLGERNEYDGNDIRILSIDETGNIRFLVRGYMNRGLHEGSIGVACYYYNSTVNSVEEEIYVPFYTSAEYLKKGMGKLAYANSSNKLFLLIDESLYRIDLVDKTYETIAENLTYGNYEVSEDKHQVAWVDLSQNEMPSSLNLLNLNNGKLTRIDSPQGGTIRPLGFVGEDLVYGLAYGEDLSSDDFGNMQVLMSQVMIRDEAGSILKTYEKEGSFVYDAEVTRSQIRLLRVAGKSGTRLDDDYIMNDVAEEAMKNEIEVVATQNLEKIVQIAIRSSMSGSKMKVLTPKQVMYEGQREISLTDGEKARTGYYIYDLKGLSSICYSPVEAIKNAEEEGSRILAGDGRCIWEKGSRSSSFQMEGITETSAYQGSSVAGCLEAMLKIEGISLNCDKLISNGESVTSILERSLTDADIMNLTGISLESALYFAGKSRPVLALLNDGNAVLIVGYNEKNTILYNPATGKISKMGINDSTEFFEANGNRFVSYIMPEL